MITISGILYDSQSSRLGHCEVFFQAIANSGESINSINRSFRTNKLGQYNIDINEGQYRVFIRSQGERHFWQIADKVIVDSDTTNQTLNDLLK